jgi:hypothetical protein
MIPQIIILAFMFLGLGEDITRHKEEKKGKYNAWIKLFAIIVWCIVLWWGDFWEPILN